MQWNLSGGASATVSFSVKVADAAHLSAALKSIDDLVNVAAIINGATQSGSGSATVPLKQQYTIAGVVRGASSDYPSTDLIDTSLLPGATVTLYCPNGNVMTTTTDANGNYSFTVKDAGAYSVEISGGAKKYSPSLNQIVPNGYTVTQTLPTFNIVQGQARTAIDLDPAYLPTGLVSRAAVEIYDLNNLPLKILSGVVDYAPFLGSYSSQYFSNYFHFDTTGVEKALDQLVAGAPVLTNDQLIGGAGATASPWLALARTNAVLDGVQQRFNSNLALADDLGKAIGLTATALAIKQIKPLLEGNRSTAQQLEYAIATQQRAKFTAIVSQDVQNRAKAMGLSQDEQDQINLVMGCVIKVVTGKSTGKGTEDAIFEIMYNCLRYGIEIQSMMSIFGVHCKATMLQQPTKGAGLQGVIDDAVNHLNADAYKPGVDTTTALQRSNKAAQTAVDWASNIHIQANAAALGCNFVIGIDKLVKKHVEILGLSGYLDDAITQFPTGGGNSLVVVGKEAFQEVFADLSIAMTTIASSDFILESADLVNTMYAQMNDATSLVATTFGM